jgi:hypothetical protein
MQGTSIDLSIEMDEKCAIGSEKKTEILTAENCFRRIMDSKKGNAGNKRSPSNELFNSGFFGEKSQSALSLLSFVTVEDELLSKDDPIPSSLSGDLLSDVDYFNI